MTKKGELFQLIKSLSRSEKRYFKMFAKMNKGSANYLRLFEAIDAQEQYDEKLIKERFKGETFAKQLHVTKNYLTKLILKSLRNFHQNHSKAGEIHDLLRDIEILFLKELYDQAWYSIEKACELALTYEKYPLLIEAYAWKRKWLLNHKGAQKSKDALTALNQAELLALRKWTNYNKYWGLVNRLMDLIRQPDETGEYGDALEAEPLFRDEKSADSLQSQILFHHLNYAYAFIKHQDRDTAESHIDQLIGILESQPHRIKDDPAPYITILTNKIASLLNYSRRNEIPAFIQKIRAVPEKYQLQKHGRLTLRLLLQTYNVELELYRDLGEIEKGIATIEASQHLLLENKNLPGNYDVLIGYQYAYLYFLAKDFKKSLVWLNYIFGLPTDRSREDILSFARFLNLIILFELKHIMVLKYAIDATRRFLKKKRNLYDFERVLLRFFSKICNLPAKDYAPLFKKLKTDIFAKTPQKEAAQALDYLDFIRWIEENKN